MTYSMKKLYEKITGIYNNIYEFFTNLSTTEIVKKSGAMMITDFVGTESTQSVNNSLNVGGVPLDNLVTKEEMYGLIKRFNDMITNISQETMMKYEFVGTCATQSVNNSVSVGNIPSDKLVIKDEIEEITNRFNSMITGTTKEGQFTNTIYRLNAEYVNDHIKLDLQNSSFYNKKIYNVKKLTVRTSYGDKIADAKIVYDNNYALLYSKLLSKASNWEFFTIEYDIIDNDKTYKPDLKGKIGRNFMQDEEDYYEYHSTRDRMVFECVYSQLGGTSRKALESRKLLKSSIQQDKTDEYAVKFKFNILARPYVGGSQSEEINSCPDILSIGSHYGNYHYQGGSHSVYSGDPLKDVGARFDITTDSKTFLKNTIAVSAGKNLDGTGHWTSYGFGVEFFEVYNREEMDRMYPVKNLTTDRAICNISGRTITADKNYIHFSEMLEIGDKVSVLYWKTDNHREDAVISKIIDNFTIEIDRDLTESPDMLLFVTLTLGATYQGGLEQSATCSIVAAKFAIIQDRTDANWQLVREAARMTASNSLMDIVNGKKVYTTQWDMKRGFGIIDVDKATEYIFDNYINNQEYKDSVVPYLSTINPLLKIDDLENNNPITKKMLIDMLSQYQKI